MMAATATVIVELVANPLEVTSVMPADADWMNTQFAAIMNASGFGDRVIVASMYPPPPHGRIGDPSATGARPRGNLMGSGAASLARRVRSPPSR